MDTIAAIATASGGALGVIRVSGPQSIDATSRILNKDISQAKGYTIHFCKVVNPEAQAGEEVIDEVLVTVFRKPHSYTGEDSVEISCHGSKYILQEIMRLLLHQGVRQARPGEFTQTAFLNGKMDLTQAEAVADLIASNTKATHRMAMSQLKGEFSRELGLLRERLLRLTSLMELELDFGEEDVEFADRTQLESLCATILGRVTQLKDSFINGNAMKEGIPVAIIGVPNVGKSTLLNALLHEDRAIVSDIQGTTRDLIEDTIAIQGISFRFIDTAGIRHTEDRIEQLGIQRAQEAAAKARIVILLTEPGVPFPPIESSEGQKVIQVVNKSPKTNGGDAQLHIEALYKRGLDTLEQALVAAAPVIPEGDIAITNLRHYEALSMAESSLILVRQGIQDNLPTDLLSQHLRQALSHLSEITGGAITPNEVLTNIFKNFCIGK